MTTLVVFSHPNHELAIFGLLQRLRPHLLYLTDGGGPDRLAQTRRGLEGIGLLSQACFLNHTEKSFYGALVARDSTFFRGVAEKVRDSICTLRPQRVFCDAIEFYNPVHDMSLPIVQLARHGFTGSSLFEVPLVYQRPGDGESYEVQRMPATRRNAQVEFVLSEHELVRKLWARDHVYTSLSEQMGPLISKLPREHLGLEVCGPANVSIPKPGLDIVLRYERRAQMLVERREIEKKITFREHYLPVATSLMTQTAGDRRAAAKAMR